MFTVVFTSFLTVGCLRISHFLVVLQDACNVSVFHIFRQWWMVWSKTTSLVDSVLLQPEKRGVDEWQQPWQVATTLAGGNNLGRWQQSWLVATT
jgi:hypothetical protein